MKITGNTILIAGGGSGIGRGLAESFHQKGDQVVIAGRRQQVLDEVTATNPGMKSILLNINDRDSMHLFNEQVAQDYPGLNVLIIPSYVQTHLTGEHQANDPRTMPLGEFITSVMDILSNRREPLGEWAEN